MTAESLATQHSQARPGKMSPAREHCARLFAAVHGFEVALATHHADPYWRSGLVESLSALHGEFRTHIDLTEGPDGLYAAVLADAPRLTHQVYRLGREHRRVMAAIEALAGRLEASPHRVRRLCRDLLGELARHRQRGADLLYEAYGIDIGGEN